MRLDSTGLIIWLPFLRASVLIRRRQLNTQPPRLLSHTSSDNVTHSPGVISPLQVRKGAVLVQGL